MWYVEEITSCASLVEQKRMALPDLSRLCAHREEPTGVIQGPSEREPDEREPLPPELQMHVQLQALMHPEALENACLSLVEGFFNPLRPVNKQQLALAKELMGTTFENRKTFDEPFYERVVRTVFGLTREAYATPQSAVPLGYRAQVTQAAAPWREALLLACEVLRMIRRGEMHLFSMDFEPYIGNFDMALADLRFDSWRFEHQIERFRNDRAFCLAAVKVNPHVFRYFRDEFKRDEEIVEETLVRWGGAWLHIADELKTEKWTAIYAVRQNGYVYRDLPTNLMRDPDVVLTAIKKSLNVWRYVPRDVIARDIDVLKVLAEEDPYWFDNNDDWLKNYYGVNWRKNKEIVMAMLKGRFGVEARQMLAKADETVQFDPEVLVLLS